ncbi:M23 family metallopeptidase [Georgenia thermotolerans]|uniref:Peptidoglycan DD-metalloendopeptidase family protein n=1 Tax=Georgenia thermotolerans TaxID=527326 RepID=A0A7J5UNR3_9MICO|nr:M23 family metallopeptidase [Georgenia thermotolerans]KAE8763987.1 peptidoglycan DD-metalloendopeptidase family protein [Georgenia thermotolerans]
MRRPRSAAAAAPPAARRRAVGRVGLVLVLALSLLGPAGVAQAGDRDDLVRQQQQNDARREKLQADLEGLDENLVETHLKLSDAEAKLPGAEAALATAQENLAAAERKQEQVTGRLAVAEQEAKDLEAAIADSGEKIAATRSAMGELARSTYRGDHTVSTVEVVLDSSSTEDFLQGYAVRETAVRAQTQVLDELETAAAVAENQRARQTAVTERIGELKEEADAAVVAADAARAEAEQRTAEIKQIQADMSELAAALEGQKGDVSGQIESLQAENKALSDEIAAIDEANRRAEEERKRKEAEAAARARAANRPAPAPAPAPAPRPQAQAGGGHLLIPPVPRPLYVTSGYGMRWYPITGGYWMHLGSDLRSACGNPQVAAAGGTVTAVKPHPNGTHGNQVIINHGYLGGSSYVTVYNHLSRFAVRAGQHVSQGQVIGNTGATGNVTGCHVHFEVWKNGSSIDPMGLPGF